MWIYYKYCCPAHDNLIVGNTLKDEAIGTFIFLCFFGVAEEDIAGKEIILPTLDEGQPEGLVAVAVRTLVG